MKNLAFIVPFIFLSCQAEVEENEVPPMETHVEMEEKPVDEIVGQWQLDSSVLINDDVEGDFEAPILPTTWTFDDAGNYTLSNSAKFSGTYYRNEKSLTVEMMGHKTEYEILVLSNQKLRVFSTVYALENSKLESKAYLTQIN